MTSRRLSMLAAGALCATALVAAPARADKLDSSLRQLSAAGAPGVIVLTRDGARTRRLARGDAILATHAPMRPTDRFRVGSVTKTFVATVVLQLVGESRLTLDDSVERWLPGVVPGGERITVRELLNHTSGLFDYTQDEAFLQSWLRDPRHEWTPSEIIGIATAHQPTAAPGAAWRYSNTGYIVLGLIAEAATGRPLATELDARIFAPLRLRATSFDSGPRIAGRHAHGYFGGGRARDVTAFSPSGAWAAGAIVSNADDVARFYRALMRGRLLRADLLNAMTTTVPIVPGARYGLGIAHVRVRCGRAWTHEGDFPGYLTSVLTSADGRREAVVMVNSDSLSDRAHRALGRVIDTAYCGRPNHDSRRR